MLVELLQVAMVPEVVKYPDMIGLCAPQDKEDYSVGIWLYDIQECAALKNYQMITIDEETQQYPSMYVNLYYMITAYSNVDLKYRAQEEAHILGKVLQTLKDTAVIDWSQHKEAEGTEPLCHIELQRLTMEEKMQIYHVPNNNYKTSLFYEVGPIELASERSRKVQRVLDAAFTINEAKHGSDRKRNER